MARDHCEYCGTATRWAKAPWGGYLLLNAAPAPLTQPGQCTPARYVVVRGVAYEPWQLRLMGDPWDGWADAAGSAAHRETCRNRPRRVAPKPRPTAQGHLGCTVEGCGVVHHRVRRYPWGDRCTDHVAVGAAGM